MRDQGRGLIVGNGIKAGAGATNGIKAGAGANIGKGVGIGVGVAIGGDPTSGGPTVIGPTGPKAGGKVPGASKGGLVQNVSDQKVAGMSGNDLVRYKKRCVWRSSPILAGMTETSWGSAAQSRACRSERKCVIRGGKRCHPGLALAAADPNLKPLLVERSRVRRHQRLASSIRGAQFLPRTQTPPQCAVLPRR